MSKVADMMIEVIELLVAGKSVEEISEITGFSEEEVLWVINDHDEYVASMDDYNESMDGDHASALASIGWGTDEDYGYFGDDF